ncbi:MAG: HAD-IA family hydrolase [Verrucomicrobiae bacterium]|nr:HAD-IA family hydrolase [Verrucomicrobiae bacterium]
MSLSDPALQAITFDVGGTLLQPHPTVGAVYARVAARHGYPALPPEALQSRFQDAWRRIQPFHHSRSDWQRLVHEVFSPLTSAPLPDSLFPALYDEFAQPSAWRVFDDVLPTLDALAAQGIDLGIVSNWDERLRPLLAALRLDRYFDCLVISCETGFAKPSPVIFEEALRQLGRPAASVLHVGDELGNDFAGATAAGLRALHLRRDAPSQDLQIQSLRDLLAWTRPPAPSEGRPA